MKEGQTENALFFDPWLIPCGSGFLSLIDQATRELEAIETRKRQRTKQANADFKLTIAVVFSNIALSFLTSLTSPQSPIAVPLTKMHRKSRYDRQGLGQLPQVISLLEAANWLVLMPATKAGLRMTIVPTPKLVMMLEALNIIQSSIAWEQGGEVIEVSRKDAKGKRIRLDYVDTPSSNKHRAKLVAINSWLANAPLEFDGEGAFHLGQRSLKRHFNLKPSATTTPPSTRGFKFNSGGRLNGGWWMPLPKEQRHLIRIAGEPIADLDFSGMFPRLAALEVGFGELDFDPYALKGFETYRTPIKRLVNAMLFPLKSLKNWPKDLAPSNFGGASLSTIRRAIHHHLPFMVQAEGKALGYRLMYLESEILIEALEAMKAAGIVALPMHDGVMVAASRAHCPSSDKYGLCAA